MATVAGRRGWRSERGAELIEFALVLPLLLLIVLGIIDFGLLFQRYEVVTNAAREGARIAVLDGYVEADVKARVDQYLTSAGLAACPTCTTKAALTAVHVGAGGTTPPCITMTGATVAYHHDYLFMGFILNLVGGSGIASRTLTATSMMRYEGPALGCP